MSSYKPVIYIFGAIGLLASVGMVVGAIQGVKELSKASTRYTMDDYLNASDTEFTGNGRMASSSNNYFDDSRMGQEDPNATQLDGRSMSTTTLNALDAATPSDDAYLGTGVLYATMEDPNVMHELKLRDDIDPAFKALLTRADSSFQELYHSDTKLALKMLASDEKVETILVQDLASGAVYDTKINAHANFKFVGPQIVYLTTGTEGTALPDELTQARVYNIETNQTKNETKLATGSSYTKMLDQYGSPIATMKVTNGKIETTVYSTKDSPRFDKERAAVRTVSFPSGR
jgi:hypothetical protein